jgi:GNAT superfamily N-acetyltransferase
LTEQTSVSEEEFIEAKAWLDLYACARQGVILETGLSRLSIGDGCAIALPSVPEITFNRAFGLRSVAQLEEAYEWLGVTTDTWAIQLDDESVDKAMESWLRERGLVTKGNGWAKFRRPASPIAYTDARQIDVRPAATSDAELFGNLVNGGFGFSAELAPLWSELVGRAGWHCFIAFLDETPVASAAMYIADRSAWLGVDSTLPQFRRKGAQAALIQARLKVGIAESVQMFTVETGQPDAGKELEHASFSNMKKAGFIQSSTRRNYRQVG